jgi:thiol-disulfide isomerase/thioredoxin
MKPATETNSQGGERPSSGRIKQQLPLIAAIGLTVIGALGLAYQLATMNGIGAPGDAESDSTSAAPVPLGPQAFSFPDRPIAVTDLKFMDATGKSISLSDFRGRSLLLNIWATWCLPCRKEMPSLDRLQAKFDPQKFLVLPLSIDRGGIPVVEKFYEQLGLKSLGMYNDQSATALQQLGLLGIPATLLINPEGREVGRRLGPAEWDSAEVATILQEHSVLPAAEPAAGANSDVPHRIKEH